MSKATVTRLFIGGGLAVIAGAILAIVAVAIANANDAFVMNGPDIVGLRGSPLAWSMLPLGIVGGIAIAGGLIAGLIAWIGALLNTWQLQSKTWFAGPAPAGDLQLRLLRDGRLPGGRARWRVRNGPPDVGACFPPYHCMTGIVS